MQRQRAHERARAFQAHHVSAGHTDNQIADDASGERINYVGALGEIVVAELFGKVFNEVLADYGDGGIDFYLTHAGIEYPVDVKTITFTGPNPRMMVTCKSIHPLTIYVLALYKDDSIRLLGWQWGAHLIKLDQRKSYSRRGTMNYTVLVSDLRPIDELRERCHA